MPSGVYVRTKEYRETMSQAMEGHIVSAETRKKIGKANKGNVPWIKGGTHSPETREKLSQSHIGRPHFDRRGKNCHLWRGGVTETNKAIRSSLEYKNWRRAVFERDNYTCVKCSQTGGYLHADHIKPFAYYTDLRFELGNGRTLCVDCHKTTDSYLKVKGRKYVTSK